MQGKQACWPSGKRFLVPSCFEGRICGFNVADLDSCSTVALALPDEPYDATLPKCYVVAWSPSSAMLVVLIDDITFSDAANGSQLARLKDMHMQGEF